MRCDQKVDKPIQKSQRTAKEFTIVSQPANQATSQKPQNHINEILVKLLLLFTVNILFFGCALSTYKMYYPLKIIRRTGKRIKEDIVPETLRRRHTLNPFYCSVNCAAIFMPSSPVKYAKHKYT